MAIATALFDEPNLVHPDLYAEHGYPHDIWTRLRAEDPVHYIEQPNGIPFWAITKHADVTRISKKPEIFGNNRRLVIGHQPETNDGEFPDTLIQMDNPKHQIFRKMVLHRFQPRELRRIHDDIEHIGKEIVDKLIEESAEGECDFVQEVSAPLPIAVIAWLLGVPKEDWELIFEWSNKIIGAGDPEYQTDGQDAQAGARATMVELFTYFAKLVEEREKNPKDDLITLFTQLEYEGEKLSVMDRLAWCLIIVIAGNETTRNGTSGGMLAFIEHQDQLRALQADPTLIDSAVEEVVRWTSPIIHFARTAYEDFELRDKVIRKGDAVALFYPSANRDEEVFEDPFSFRISRKPNRHLGFGVGEHFCLGSHLARLELKVAYKHLLPRIEEIELAGPVERLHSGLVGGVKHLPIRYRIKPA
ncbi:MAG: cytochrome P450 [Myxococcota bacterium]